MNQFNWKRGLTAGGILSLIILLMFVGVIYEANGKPEVVYDYTCEVPDDIPSHYENGTKIYWDCGWYASYKAGRVKVFYNEDGTLEGIGRTRAK